MSLFKSIASALTQNHPFRNAKISVNLPYLRYEIDLDQALYPRTVDERIERLDQIRTDLIAAIDAVTELQSEALENKREAEELRDTVKQLEQDKVSAETLLTIPEDSFSRIITKANSKARFRGIAEGALIGLLTGVASSWLVWYFTS